MNRSGEFLGAAQRGMTGFDFADATLVPRAFRAATVNVYTCPLVKPLTKTLVARDRDTFAGCATPPRYGVRTYAVMAAPFVLDGADHVSFTCPRLAATVTGGVPGVVGAPTIT